MRIDCTNPCRQGLRWMARLIFPCQASWKVSYKFDVVRGRGFGLASLRNIQARWGRPDYSGEVQVFLIIHTQKDHILTSPSSLPEIILSSPSARQVTAPV